VRVWQAALLIGLAVFAAPLATVEQPPAQGASHRFPHRLPTIGFREYADGGGLLA